MITTNSQRGGRGAGRSMGRQDTSIRNANLAKLLEFVDSDVLAAAVLMPEDQIAGFLQNREVIRGQHADQLSQYLGYAGFPDGWLDIPNSRVDAGLAQGLMSLAAEAINLAPLRRANLKRLAKAFEGRYSLLADCIEIREDSLVRMLNGHQVFDDQRMGHINPLLVRAGFPNNWLETANGELTPAMTQNLERCVQEPEPEPELEVAPPRKPTLTKTKQAPAPARADPVSTPAAVAAPASKPEAKSASAAKPKPTKAAVKQTKAASPAPAAALAAPVVAPQATTRIPGLSMGVQRAARPIGGGPAKSPQVPAAARVIPRDGRSGADLETRARYKARANALQTLLNTARRGAKVCLWRDLLGRSLPYWANVRGGGIAFQDEMANKVTSALGLPAGWLDNPVFPPPTLASWVTDTSVPLPVSPSEAAAEVSKQQKSETKVVAAPINAPAPVAPAAVAAEPVITRKRPVVEKSVVEVPDRTGVFVKQVPTVRKRVIKATPGIHTADAPPAPQIPSILLAAKPVTDAPTVAQVIPAAPALVVQQNLATPIATVPGEALPAPVVQQPASFGLVLAEGPARETVGPVARAVADTLLDFSKSGRLSEQEAVRFLAYLHGVPILR